MQRIAARCIGQEEIRKGRTRDCCQVQKGARGYTVELSKIRDRARDPEICGPQNRILYIVCIPIQSIWHSRISCIAERIFRTRENYVWNSGSNSRGLFAICCEWICNWISHACDTFSHTISLFKFYTLVYFHKHHAWISRMFLDSILMQRNIIALLTRSISSYIFRNKRHFFEQESIHFRIVYMACVK